MHAYSFDVASTNCDSQRSAHRGARTSTHSKCTMKCCPQTHTHTNTKWLQLEIYLHFIVCEFGEWAWWILQNMLLVVFVERPAHLHQIPSSRVDLHLEHILSFVRKHQPLKVNEIEIEIVSSCVRVCFESTSENDMFTRVDHHMNDANHCAIWAHNNAALLAQAPAPVPAAMYKYKLLRASDRHKQIDHHLLYSKTSLHFRQPNKKYFIKLQMGKFQVNDFFLSKRMKNCRPFRWKLHLVTVWLTKSPERMKKIERSTKYI